MEQQGNDKSTSIISGGSDLTVFLYQTGKWAPTPSALRNRAREVRRWLRARPEKEIVLVTHGGILHYITEDWEDSSAYQGAQLILCGSCRNLI
jgi:broad specificity phosphatase PhoE